MPEPAVGPYPPGVWREIGELTLGPTPAEPLALPHCPKVGEVRVLDQCDLGLENQRDENKFPTVRLVSLTQPTHRQTGKYAHEGIDTCRRKLNNI